MHLESTAIRAQLGDAFFVLSQSDGSAWLNTPFRYPDGDHYPFYLAESGPGRLRVSDGAHTLMHLSYEADVDSLLIGPHRVLFDRTIREGGVSFDEAAGELYVDADQSGLVEGVFRLGQTISRIEGLAMRVLDTCR